MKFIYILGLSFCLLSGMTLTPVSAQQNESNYFLHTVTKGQSLYSISSMYNVSIDDIVRLNPGSDVQIRAGEALKIPQAQTTDRTQQQRFHTIQAGETLYQLTVKYNVTAQAICNANPGLSASNFRIGQVVVIPSEQTAPPSQPTAAAANTPSTNGQKTNTWREMHKVEKKETLYSISKLYGITQEELIAANPDLKKGKLKKGTFLFIPYAKQATTAPQQTATPTNEELFNENSRKGKSMPTIKAALLLSFSGNNEEQSRMVEFYEGFLIAADSLKRKGVSMDIYTYDTKGNASEVNRILSQPLLKEMDIIFGPVQSSAIPAVTAFAEKNNIRLVIPFAPKVDQVFKNPNIYQINTPQSYLYSEVYEHFLRKFKHYNIVFVSDGANDREKADFVKGLKNELKDNNIRFRQIELDGEVDGVKVIAAMDTLQENIFIPTSGRSTTLTKVLPHLTLVRKEHPHFDMHLFGYPEWQTYTQDFLSTFYELDTYFYSSFYTNNLFPAAINFTQSYRRWYSKDMANTYPKYGMLGFDIGYYFMQGLSQWGSNLEDHLSNMQQVTPIQTGFKFERVNNWGGFINRKVFFVHFTKDYELIKLDFD